MSLASGLRAEYLYAWRGGPLLLKVTAKTDALLDRAVAVRAGEALEAFRALSNPNDGFLLSGLITRYLASGAMDKLAPRTQKDRRKFLAKAKEEIGHFELRLLKAPTAKKTLIEWRNQHKDHPKTADELLGSVATVLRWAKGEGEIEVNPLEDVTRLYESDRSDLIWEESHLAILFPHCAIELKNACELAMLTGGRLADLIALTWSNIGESAVTWQTNKSRKRRTVVAPITPELRGLLDRIPRQAGSLTILNSARGKPWTIPGLESAMWRAKQDALAQVRKIKNDPEAKSGIEHLRFHDFRGTACTHFIRGGLAMSDIAIIMGWEPARVQQIAIRYVTSEEVGKALVRRLERNRTGTKTVKRPVKRSISRGAESPKR